MCPTPAGLRYILDSLGLIIIAQGDDSRKLEILTGPPSTRSMNVSDASAKGCDEDGRLRIKSINTGSLGQMPLHPVTRPRLP